MRTSTMDPIGRVAAAHLAAPDRPDLLAELSAALREVVPYEAAAWFATDPITGLPTAPAYADGIGPECWECAWANEFSEQDVLLFRDLARAAVPAGTLQQATEGVPERSPRYRHRLSRLSVADELRAVFRLGAVSWGQVTLLRCGAGPSFGAADCEVLAAAGPTIAAALRARIARVQAAPRTGRPPGPGTVVYSRDGRRQAWDEAAAAWFGEFAGAGWDGPARPAGMAAATAVVARANALSWHRGLGPSQARLRADNGRWIVLSASATETGDGSPGPTVLLVDAARSSQVAEVLVEAFGLTRRERDVTRALMLGLSNAEIAGRLAMSAHTVRDHLAAVFDKARVGSRGELVARLLGEPGVEGH